MYPVQLHSPLIPSTPSTLQSPLVEPVVTPRSVISCTDSLLDTLGQLAAEYGLRVQVGII